MGLTEKIMIHDLSELNLFSITLTAVVQVDSFGICMFRVRWFFIFGMTHSLLYRRGVSVAPLCNLFCFSCKGPCLWAIAAKPEDKKNIDLTLETVSFCEWMILFRVLNGKESPLQLSLNRLKKVRYTPGSPAWVWHFSVHRLLAFGRSINTLLYAACCPLIEAVVNSAILLKRWTKRGRTVGGPLHGPMGSSRAERKPENKQTKNQSKQTKNTQHVSLAWMLQGSAIALRVRRLSRLEKGRPSQASCDKCMTLMESPPS